MLTIDVHFEITDAHYPYGNNRQLCPGKGSLSLMHPRGPRATQSSCRISPTASCEPLRSFLVFPFRSKRTMTDIGGPLQAGVWRVRGHAGRAHQVPPPLLSRPCLPHGPCLLHARERARERGREREREQVASISTGGRQRLSIGEPYFFVRFWNETCSTIGSY